MAWLDRDDRPHWIEPQFRLVRHTREVQSAPRSPKVAAVQGCDAGLIRMQLS